MTLSMPPEDYPATALGLFTNSASQAGEVRETQNMTRRTGGGAMRRRVLLGIVPTLLAYVVFTMWVLVFFLGNVRGTIQVAVPAAYALLAPCAVIAYLLTVVSFRVSGGTGLGVRVLSLVLWQAATPVVWSLGFGIWSGLENSQVEAGAAALWAIPFGLALWCACLTPVFLVVLGRRVLADDPETVAQVARRSRDEIDEDHEIEKNHSSGLDPDAT